MQPILQPPLPVGQDQVQETHLQSPRSKRDAINQGKHIHHQSASESKGVTSPRPELLHPSRFHQRALQGDLSVESVRHVEPKSIHQTHTELSEEGFLHAEVVGAREDDHPHQREALDFQCTPHQS